MKTVRSAEITLLLLVCSVEPSDNKSAEIRLFLEQRTLDWNRLFALASYHRLTPFLYRACLEASPVPAWFLSTLRQECLLITTDNLIKLKEYHRVAALLEGRAIDHIAFKGIYLAQHSYPECGLRPIGDMDIMVAGKDLYKTISLLSPEGYRVGDTYKPYLEHPKGIIWDKLCEISLFKPYNNTSRLDIDLHWQVKSLLKTIGIFELSEFQSAPDFALENQVILLVIHHGVNNSWERIGYINDIYFVLNQGPIDWEWLLKKMRQYQLEGLFFMGLHWCQQLWSLTLPPVIQHLMQGVDLTTLIRAYERKWEKPSLTSFRQTVVDFANSQGTFNAKWQIYTSYAHDFVFRSTIVTINHRQFYVPRQWGFATVVLRAVSALMHSR